MGGFRAHIQTGPTGTLRILVRRGLRLLLCIAFVFLVYRLSYLRSSSSVLDARALEQLGNIDSELSQEPDPSMEVQDLERRVARDPEAAVALAHLARAYLSIGVVQHDSTFIDRAEARAKSSLEIAAYHNIAALEVLARVASYRHEFERSIELAKQLIEIGASQGFEILIPSLVAQRRLDEARGSALEFSRLQPGFSSFLQMGLTAEASGDLATAEDNYLAALKTDPQSSRTASLWSRSIVARFFLRQGRLDEASILLRKVLQFDPKYPFALGLEGELSLARGQYRVAAERFQRAFLASRDPTYLYSAALAFRRYGDERSWRESLDAIITLSHKAGRIETAPHKEVFEKALRERGD